MDFRPVLTIVLLLIFNGEATAQSANAGAKEADAVLSRTFRVCFGKDAPLNAESYGCLDREYHRLDALLTTEYRAALARQPDDTARMRLKRDQHSWWRIRFRHCRDEVGDLSGSTARVVNESCEIVALAQRIVRLRHHQS